MEMIRSIHWHPVAPVQTFPLHMGRRFRLRNQDIAIFNLGTRLFRALDNACPSEREALADGEIRGDWVCCPRHALKINLHSGDEKSHRGMHVRTYPVRVHEDMVYLGL